MGRFFCMGTLARRDRPTFVAQNTHGWVRTPGIGEAAVGLAWHGKADAPGPAMPDPDPDHGVWAISYSYSAGGEGRASALHYKRTSRAIYLVRGSGTCGVVVLALYAPA